MANNDVLIYKGKALKDLRGIKDVLQAQGDPFLANIMHRAIECIENQPAAGQAIGKLERLDVKSAYVSPNDNALNLELSVKMESNEPAAFWECLSQTALARVIAEKLNAYLTCWLRGGTDGR